MSGGYDDEQIGYGRPPSWTQFRKGRSGNPTGRPPKPKKQVPPPTSVTSATDDIIRRELNRTVKVNDANGSQELTMLEVAIRAQLTAAAKGNVHAQRDVLKRAHEVEARDTERSAQAEREKEETFINIVNWRLTRQKVWDEAIANGCEPDEPWPHPDDILINKATQRWKIRGPIDESDLPFFEYIRAQRELIRWQMMEAVRERRGKGWVWEFYGHLMIRFDVMLPKRWQIGDGIEALFVRALYTSLKHARREIEYWEESVRTWTILAHVPEPDRECHQIAAKIMKPIMNHYGFRSLAQFERDYEEKGEALV
jgi:Family of unknown function (DUF5681)